LVHFCFDAEYSDATRRRGEKAEILRNPGTRLRPNIGSVRSDKDNRIYATNSPVSGAGTFVQVRLL